MRLQYNTLFPIPSNRYHCLNRNSRNTLQPGPGRIFQEESIMKSNQPTRRSVMTAPPAAAPPVLLKPPPPARAADSEGAAATKGNINHSVCLWCYKNMKSSDMAPHAQRLGLKAIDLLIPEQF